MVAENFWVGVHRRFGVVILAPAYRKPTEHGVMLWIAAKKTEVYFDREGIKTGLVPASKSAELAGRDFGPEIAEYERYLQEHRFDSCPGEGPGIGSGIDEFGEGVPVPGWFTDEGWRRLHPGYRRHSR
jgi:hypothetical protein